MTTDEWVEAYNAMRATLPDVNAAVRRKYDEVATRRMFPQRYQEAVTAYETALAESARIQGEFGDRARAAGICVSCLDKNGPRHNASSRCESGGRNHCTCDVCF